MSSAGRPPYGQRRERQRAGSTRRARTSATAWPGSGLLAAIVIYWSTAHLREAVRQRKLAGLAGEPELLAHISLLGWGHIPAHRPIPAAKAPIAALAYDSAPYLNRPVLATRIGGQNP